MSWDCSYGSVALSAFFGAQKRDESVLKELKENGKRNERKEETKRKTELAPDGVHLYVYGEEGVPGGLVSLKHTFITKREKTIKVYTRNIDIHFSLI